VDDRQVVMIDHGHQIRHGIVWQRSMSRLMVELGRGLQVWG